MPCAKFANPLSYQRLLAAFALLCFHAAGICADDLLTSQMVDEARLWQSKGRSDLAINTWRRILITHPDHVEALSNTGLIQAKAGNLPEARELYQRAKRQGKPHAALTRLEALLKQAPTDAEPRANAAPPPAASSHIPTVASKGTPTTSKPSAPDFKRGTSTTETGLGAIKTVHPGGSTGKESRDLKSPTSAKHVPPTAPLEPVPPPNTEVRVTPLPLAAISTGQATVIQGDGHEDIALKPAETLRGAVVTPPHPVVSSSHSSARRPKPCRLPLTSNAPSGTN